jgi:hypothetical protein
MTAAQGGDPLEALALQLGQLGEQLGALDEREAGDVHKLQESLAQIHVRLTAHLGMIRRQSAALDKLDGLKDAIARLSEQLKAKGKCGTEDGEEDGYEPIPVVPWWEFIGEPGEKHPKEQAAAVARLRAWVEQIYRPLYGHLAAQLGECWEAHPLALVTLDWLSELWSVLYLNADRDARQVGQQAELGIRILPTAVAILGDETRGCELHGARVNGYQVPRVARR